jgi:uncharacterized membrane protein
MNSSPSDEVSSPVDSSSALNPPLVFSAFVTVLLSSLAMWAWWRIPADARIATHWDAMGRVNGYGGRNTLFFVPATVLGMSVLLRFIPLIDPRRSHILLSSRAYRAVWIAVVLFLSGIQAIMVGAALGYSISVGKWMFAGMGLVFVIVGNVLGKVRSNFFFGVRTPWTLSSELAWNRTHRLAGWMFVIYGLCETVAAVSGVRGNWLTSSVIGFVSILGASVCAYSYVVWRNDPNRLPSGAPKLK